MSEIVFYMIVAIVVAGCHGEKTYNGNFTCDADRNSTYVADVEKEQVAIKCGKNRTRRLEMFEVDCCISEVTQNIVSFKRIFRSVVIETIKVSFIIFFIMVLSKILTLQHPNLTTCTPERNNNDNVSLENLKSMLNGFSSTCKRYTHIMAFKQQLQCHIFNTALEANTVSLLTNLIITLQIAAVKLQKLEVIIFY